MIPKDFEQQIGLGMPLVSPKTKHEQLVMLSKQRWPSDGRKRIAADIIKNGQELLAGSKIDWVLVLNNISTNQHGVLYNGEAAIAAHDGQLVGALAVASDWSTHDSPIVYLSGRLLASRAKSSGELDDFKRIMMQTAVNYGQKVLPHPDSYMRSLDFLLEVENRTMHRKTMNRVGALLVSGDIEEAYKIVESFDDIVRRRV